MVEDAVKRASQSTAGADEVVALAIDQLSVNLGVEIFKSGIKGRGFLSLFECMRAN